MKSHVRALVLHNAPYRLFWLLIAVGGFSIAVYMYGISMSIVNVVLREELDRKVAQTHSQVATLEAIYLQKKDAIDFARAEASGFAPVKDKEFVTRQGLSLSVSR